MYPLPRKFEGKQFLSHSVEMVCFAEYQVNLHFSGGAILQIECDYILELDGVTESGNPDEGLPASSRLIGLIGDTVTGLTFDRQSGDLAFEFGRGARLAVKGDSGPYESYRIVTGSKEIIV